MRPEDVLLSRGLVTPEQLRSAAEQSLSGDASLFDSLVGGGVLTAEQLGWHVADAHELPFVRLTPGGVDGDLARHLGARFLRPRCAVPLRAVHDEITFALADVDAAEPLAGFADALGGGVDVQFVVAPEDQIRDELDALFGSAAERAAPARRDASSAASTLHALLLRSIESGARELRFDPTFAGLAVRLADAGGARRIDELPLDAAASIEARVRALLAGAREGVIDTQVNGRRVELRFDVAQTELGAAVRCRIDHGDAPVPDVSRERGQSLAAARSALLDGPAIAITATDAEQRARLVAGLLAACGEAAQPVVLLDGAVRCDGAAVVPVRRLEDAVRLAPRVLIAPGDDEHVSDLRALAVHVPSLVLVRREVTAAATMALLPRRLRPLVRGALCPRGYVEATSWT